MATAVGAVNQLNEARKTFSWLFFFFFLFGEKEELDSGLLRGWWKESLKWINKVCTDVVISLAANFTNESFLMMMLLQGFSVEKKFLRILRNTEIDFILHFWDNFLFGQIFITIVEEESDSFRTPVIHLRLYLVIWCVPLPTVQLLKNWFFKSS